MIGCALDGTISVYRGYQFIARYVCRAIVTSDHGVSLTRKDGSVSIFHLYGQKPQTGMRRLHYPSAADLLKHGYTVFRDAEEAGTKVRQADAIEI